MKALLRSQVLAAAVGGLAVAGALLAFGVTGRRSTETIVQQAPVTSDASAGGLTPHDIYDRDAPGVVFVHATVVQHAPTPFELTPPRRQSVSTGSGFLVDAAGHILTNYHVIQGADRRAGVSVQFEDDVTRSASVVAEDQDSDLAVLKVDMGGVPVVQPLELGDSTSVQVGDPTLAIGNPFGLARTLTSGIVSALQRQIRGPNGFSIDNVIQTDAPINPGNSGGPLLDGAGRVIGINSQIETAAGGGGSIGIAFAIPINTAQSLIRPLEQGEPVKFAYLGISGAARRGGVVVVRARPGGPAAGAGLQAGDVIRAVAGQAVQTMTELQLIVGSCSPGQTVPMRVVRAGHTETVKVTLGSSP